ncbi:hypothetical protein [Streptomyces griseoluteus]|uniref:hypothetical protein n=1 Tax=Streptomyces griseoluteus TaxID=29306 RepID=UPI00369A3CDF
MGEHVIALKERMQQLQETVRRALVQHDTFQMRLSSADLTHTRRAWNVLCGLSDVPQTARPTVTPTAAEPHLVAPVRDQIHQVPDFTFYWSETGISERLLACGHG